MPPPKWIPFNNPYEKSTLPTTEIHHAHLAGRAPKLQPPKRSSWESKGTHPNANPPRNKGPYIKGLFRDSHEHGRFWGIHTVFWENERNKNFKQFLWPFDILPAIECYERCLTRCSFTVYLKTSFCQTSLLELKLFCWGSVWLKAVLQHPLQQFSILVWSWTVAEKKWSIENKNQWSGGNKNTFCLLANQKLSDIGHWYAAFTLIRQFLAIQLTRNRCSKLRHGGSPILQWQAAKHLA